MSKIKSYLILLSAASHFSCVTSQSAKPMSYEEYKAERKSELKSLSVLLEETRSALFSDKAIFDHCFMDSVNKQMPGEPKAAVKISAPKDGKFSLVEISPPEQVRDHAEFERCIRLVINRLNTDIEADFFNDPVAIVSPSWNPQTATAIEPSKFQVPAGAVCLQIVRQFYKIKNWDIRKVGKQKVSDSPARFVDEDITVCSGQDLAALFKWDFQELKAKYPGEDLDGYIVIDGIE